jgi:lipoprotein-releasing system permease protein
MIHKNVVLGIAVRHLLVRKRQTVVAMLGVMFGISIFIIQAGLITGMQMDFIQRIVDNSAHIHLYNEPETNRKPLLSEVPNHANQWIVVHHQKPKDVKPEIINPDAVIRLIEKNKAVTGVSAFLTTQVFFKNGTYEVPGNAVGVDIERENKLFNLAEDMVDGSILSLKANPSGVIVGSGLAKKLSVRLGDYVRLTSALGISFDLKVVGIIKTGVIAVDNTRAIVSTANAQQLIAKSGSYITDINLKIKDVDQADELAQRLQRETGYTAVDWKKANESLFSVFIIQRMITAMVITTIMIVSGFGIFNILNMMIYEKLPDIAILKSMGFSNKEVMRIFLFQAMTIGFFGGLLGLMVGYVVSVIVSKIPLNIEREITMTHLTINFSPYFYLTAFIFGILTTAAAGYFPARRASRIDPVEIIRNKA